MGPKSQTTSSQNQPPAAVQQQYTNLINQANTQAGQPLQQYSAPMIQGFTPQQQQGFQAVQNAQGVANPYINSASQLFAAGSAPITPTQFSADQVGQYVSPYVNNVVGATAAEMANQDAQQQQGVIGNAISKGAWGGDRAGIAQAELANQQDLANNQTIAGLYNQAYSQGLGEFNTQQAAGTQAQQASDWIAQNAGYGTAALGSQAQSSALTGANALLSTGGLQQQLGQEQMNIPYEQFQAQRAYPYQNIGWLSNISQGIGSGMGGQSSTTSPGPSTAGQIAGLGATTAGALGSSGAFGMNGWLTGTPVQSIYDAGGAQSILDSSVIQARGGRVAGFAPGGSISPLGNSPMGGEPISVTSGVPDVSVSYIPQGGMSTSPSLMNRNYGQSQTTQQPDQTLNYVLDAAKIAATIAAMARGGKVPGFAPGGSTVGNGSFDTPVAPPTWAYFQGGQPNTSLIGQAGIIPPNAPSSMSTTGNMPGSSVSSGTSPSQLNSLYGSMLGRTPDASGSAYWADKSPGVTQQGIVNSPEYQSQGPITGFVPSAGRGIWIPQLKDPSSTPQSWSGPNNADGSPGWFNPLQQYKPPGTTTSNVPNKAPQIPQSVDPSKSTMSDLNAMFQNYLGRPATAADFAASNVGVPQSDAAIYQGILKSPEYAKYAATAPWGLSDKSQTNYPSTSYSPPYQMGMNRGGRAGFDAGGALDAAGSVNAGDPAGNGNPLVQQALQRFTSMPMEQLRELAVRIPPTNPQGQMIHRALMIKQMNPQADTAQQSGLAQPNSLSAPPAPTGVSVQSMAYGGRPGFDDGGTADIANPMTVGHPGMGIPQPPPAVPPAQMSLSGNLPTALNPNAGMMPPPSSGGGGSPGSSLATNPWMALTQAGLGMMASRSPFPGVAIGEGGMQGLKTLEQQKELESETGLRSAQTSKESADARMANMNADFTAGKLKGMARTADILAGNTSAMPPTKSNYGPEAQTLSSAIAKTAGALKDQSQAVSDAAVKAADGQPTGPQAAPIASSPNAPTSKGIPLPPHVQQTYDAAVNMMIYDPAGGTALQREAMAADPNIVSAKTAAEAQAKLPSEEALELMKLGGAEKWKYDTYLKTHPGDTSGALEYAGGFGAVRNVNGQLVSVVTHQPLGSPGWQGGAHGQDQTQAAPPKIGPVGTFKPEEEVPHYDISPPTNSQQWQRESVNTAVKNAATEAKAVDSAAATATRNRADLGNLANLLASPDMQTNKFAPFKANLSAIINAATGDSALATSLTGIDPAKADVFQKDSTRMGLTFARQTEGAREAVQAIKIALGANPQMSNTLEGNRQIIKLLDEGAQRDIDEQKYQQAYFTDNKHYVGFQPWFNQAHPAAEYTSKVIPYEIPHSGNQVSTGQLQSNVTYRTKNGPAYWNGSTFVAAQ